MAEKMLMKGNEAIAEAAVQAGCRFFFGYPITPQNQIPEYMSKRLHDIQGACFLQAESEIAAINMVYGAAGAGARVMTSSSGPGISLKQEGISYLAGAELPCVIVNISRGGPGLGSIQPSQSDYYQSTRGGGHGDYRTPVLAPSSVQEAAELTQLAFDMADRYRNPVMLLGDGLIGQMMEPVLMPDYRLPADLPQKDWAAVGKPAGGSAPRAVINSLYLDSALLEKHVNGIYEKYAVIQRDEVRYQAEWTEDADYILVAYGAAARIARSAIRRARAMGIHAGLLRPITLWPFPADALRELAARAKAFLSVEMSMGQMIDDVRLALDGLNPVFLCGRAGGMVPSVQEVTDAIVKLKEGV